MKLSRLALALALSACLLPLPACGGTGGTDAAVDDEVVEQEEVLPTEDEAEGFDDELDEVSDEAEDGDAADEDGDAAGSVAVGEGKRVGERGIGFVTVPDSWTEFVDVDGNTSLQWCDGTPYTIISLNTFDLESVPEDQREGFSVEDAANSVYANILNGGVSQEDVEGAHVTLAGRDALQIYARYPDGSFLVTWSLVDDDGVIHYVAAEGTENSIMDAVGIVEASYAFDE